MTTFAADYFSDIKMAYSNLMYQYSLFDEEDLLNAGSSSVQKLLNNRLSRDFSEYNLEQYKADIETRGVKETWNEICSYLLDNYSLANAFLRQANLGQLYEMALAIEDKHRKKGSGQYYTPEDVALVMADWFHELDAENVCDVACGTGNLILSYLELIGKREAERLIAEGKIYLYDNDETALQICITSILLKYGVQYQNLIHACHCDFLDCTIHLPEHCKVISNPPYAKIATISHRWSNSKVVADTKEYYAAFIEKIISQSERSVIITPYSFMSGSKFYSLRRSMNDYNGFIVAFDNVPGNIFAGKKFGIFNSNTSNSVRAAITVVENKPNIKGFRTSHFIRFKNVERERLLNTRTLESFLGDEYQTVSLDKPMYYKCDRNLAKIYHVWEEKSDSRLFNYVSAYGRFLLSMPNTCRYTTVASSKELKRSGQILLRFTEEDVYNFVYCLINSSFTYWYWRLFDGGITYQKGLLLSLPMCYDMLTDDDKKFFKETAEEMRKLEEKCIVTKSNVGIQENLKFPKSYRDRINHRLFGILNIKEDVHVFDRIHSNMALEVSLCNE